MDIEEFRRLRLRELIDTRFGGNATAFATAIGRRQPHVNRWLTTTAKERRALSEKSCRYIVRKLGLPERYFDSDDDDGSIISRFPVPQAPKPSVAAALALLEPLFAPLSADARESVALLLRGWIFNPGNNNAELIEALVSASATNRRVEQTYGQPLSVHEPSPPFKKPKRKLNEKR